MAKTKEWTDFDVFKTFAVSFPGLPRRIYKTYSPRDAIEGYKRDIGLGEGRDISKFLIHEVYRG